MANAWPDETIGIIKLAVGGTSVLAWKPDWSREDADRVGQGRHGSLYKKLMEKSAAAGNACDGRISEDEPPRDVLVPLSGKL